MYMYMYTYIIHCTITYIVSCHVMPCYVYSNVSQLMFLCCDDFLILSFLPPCPAHSAVTSPMQWYRWMLISQRVHWYTTVVNHAPQHLATQVADGVGLIGGQLEGVAVLGDRWRLHVCRYWVGVQYIAQVVTSNNMLCHLHVH